MRGKLSSKYEFTEGKENINIDCNAKNGEIKSAKNSQAIPCAPEGPPY